MASSEDEVVVRLRLKDVRQFIADVKAGKLAIDDLEKKVRKAGQTAARESSSSGGFGLFASLTKHLAFAVPMAIAGAAAATASYAVKSASDLEMVGVSFETLLHSASRAKTMVSDLQDFAQRTPFRLPDVEAGAQSLLGYRFAGDQVISMLTAVGDATAGLNLGQGGFSGIITALGQIKAKTRVQGDEILQLNERGILAQEYLAKGLHMTPQQLRKAIEANKISADKAIPIILKGMEKDFGGLMDKQAKTLGGLWSNFLDAAQRALIGGVNPMLPSIKKWVQGATDAIPTIQAKFSRMGDVAPYLRSNVPGGADDTGASYMIARMLGDSGDTLAPQIEKIIKIVRSLASIVTGSVVPALQDMTNVLKLVSPLLSSLEFLTGLAADHSTTFHVALDALVVGFASYKLLLLAVNGVLKAQAIWTGINEIATSKFTTATNAQKVALVLYKGAQLAAVAATKIWTGAQWLLNFAMDANPIGAVILVVGLLATAFYLAYTKVKPFRDFINGLWADMRGFNDWITSVWNPTQWSNHAEATTRTIDPSLVGGATDIAAQNGGAVAHPGPLISIGHASGGTMTAPHTAWVGERGPELLNLPRGSQVIPLPRVGELGGPRHIEIPVVLNGREIARAVYDDMEDRIARR